MALRRRPCAPHRPRTDPASPPPPLNLARDRRDAALTQLFEHLYYTAELSGDHTEWVLYGQSGSPTVLIGEMSVVTSGLTMKDFNQVLAVLH